MYVHLVVFVTIIDGMTAISIPTMPQRNERLPYLHARPMAFQVLARASGLGSVKRPDV
jgi:hypothetical protein